MKVAQPDSRSIAITSQTGVRVHVPYRFFWNGHERPAESIVLTEWRGGWDVRAFFLFGEIRDRLSEDAFGITLARTWLVRTPGSVHLSIELEMDPGHDLHWLFPGAAAGEGLPEATLSFLGEKTSAPCALAMVRDGQGMVLFSRTAWSDGEQASIGMGRTEAEDEPPLLRLEVRFPGVEEPAGRTGPRPDHLVAPEEKTIESPGSLERSHQLFMVFSPAEDIVREGRTAVLQRIMRRPEKSAKAAGAAAVDVERLAQAVSASLPSLLLEDGGVAGIREQPGSPWLSSTAGLGVSLEKTLSREGIP